MGARAQPRAARGLPAAAKSPARARGCKTLPAACLAAAAERDARGWHFGIRRGSGGTWERSASRAHLASAPPPSRPPAAACSRADELIRQVTINCAERGLLLLRVRDEIRMTIAAYQVRSALPRAPLSARSTRRPARRPGPGPARRAHRRAALPRCCTPRRAAQTLYESSIAFGMRKALHAEQGRADMEASIAALQAEKEELGAAVLELKAKAEAIEKREGERRALEEKKHADEVAFLKKSNAALKRELEAFLAPAKK